MWVQLNPKKKLLGKYSEAVVAGKGDMHTSTMRDRARGRRPDLALAPERGPNRAPARGRQGRSRPAGGERRRWVRCDGCRGKAGGDQRRARASLPWQQSSPRPGGSRLHAGPGEGRRTAARGGGGRHLTPPPTTIGVRFGGIKGRERGRTEQTLLLFCCCCFQFSFTYCVSVRVFRVPPSLCFVAKRVRVPGR
jgi:hypothetical protein